jgi:hypothetical protein
VCECLYLSFGLRGTGESTVLGTVSGLNLDPYYNSRTAAAAAGGRLLGGNWTSNCCTHTTWKHSTTTQHIFSTITMDTILAGGSQKIAAQIQTKWRPIFSITRRSTLKKATNQPTNFQTCLPKFSFTSDVNQNAPPKTISKLL